MNKKTLLVGLSTATAGCFAVATFADITNSDHDFSDTGWTDEICLPCHTPHNADTSVAEAPLWNHELTVETNYILYGGGSGSYSTDLDGFSRLCLSCHDGTVALDSFGGNSGGTPMDPGDGAFIGIDLSDDHPIGSTAVYPTSFPDSDFNDPSGFPAGFELKDLAGDNVVSCATCHDPHNSGNYGDMLRMDNTGSALCLTCHIK